jgi:hypothetical protein
MIEQANALAEEYGHEVDLHFIDQRVLKDFSVTIGRATGWAVALAPTRQIVHPVMEPFTALPQGLVNTSVRPGDETVQ